MTLVIVLVAVVLVIVAVVAAVFISARRSAAPVPVEPEPRMVGPTRLYTEAPEPMQPFGPAEPEVQTIVHDDEIASLSERAESRTAVAAVSPVPVLFDLEQEAGAGPMPSAAQPARVIDWSTAFDPRSGTLDDIARLRLIGDLGVIAKEWCVPLLSQAYDQEVRPTNRQAALIALSACRTRTAIPVYQRAIASGDEAERAIATDALSDLEPTPKTKLRTVVERR